MQQSMGSSTHQVSNVDLSTKIVLIGDAGVGKSSILLSFVSNSAQDIKRSVGVDFKIKQLTVGGKTLKLTIWDTAGQERFGTLTRSYYRNADGIILVYDMTRRETFTNLTDIWMKEAQLYSTNKDCVKILVGNKIDRDSERVVSREEGMALAKELGCSFLECSAKTGENVEECFRELAQKIVEVCSPLEEGKASQPQKENTSAGKGKASALKQHGPPPLKLVAKPAVYDEGGGGGGGGTIAVPPNCC